MGVWSRLSVGSVRGVAWYVSLAVIVALVVAGCGPVVTLESTVAPSETLPSVQRTTAVGPTPRQTDVTLASTPTVSAQNTPTATETPAVPAKAVSVTVSPASLEKEVPPSSEAPIPPGVREVAERARQDLAMRLGVEVRAIDVVEVEAVEWPDASLGCPKPGMAYAQVMTFGYRIVLEAEGKQYEYHSGRELLVFCEGRGEGTTATKVPADIPPTAWPIPQLGIAVTVPGGFRISVFAEGLSGPRFMTTDSQGVLFVAERGANRVVALPDTDGDGRADGQIVVADGMIAPSSLAFHEGALYVGETTQITRLVLGQDLRAVERNVVVPDLSGAVGHSTRTVIFGSDGRMYVSVGSSCNVCLESDPRRAAISVYPPGGGAGQVYATGLRNAVGLAVNPWTGSLWATNNGRDRMGDDAPPETVYAIHEGANYGWPRCHAGDILDPQYGRSGDCEGVEEPVVEMQAHSAPLGMAFYDGQEFPSEYRQNAYIAFHGSWNRTIPTGYKVVRVPVQGDRAGGPVQDFATGWLQPDGSAPGRPVGVTVGADGSLFVSDDRAGLVYRITYEGGG